jgi:ankyrin repeat protein
MSEKPVPGDGDNALMFYARISGSHREIFRLAAGGHDIHAQDDLERTSLTLATVSDVKNVLVLLRRGANIRHRDVGGDTPLHWAVYHKNANVARLLLKKGADMDHKNDKGQTPMQLAAMSGDEAVAEAFIAAKNSKLTDAFVKGTAERITVGAPLQLSMQPGPVPKWKKPRVREEP